MRIAGIRTALQAYAPGSAACSACSALLRWLTGTCPQLPAAAPWPPGSEAGPPLGRLESCQRLFHLTQLALHLAALRTLPLHDFLKTGKSVAAKPQGFIVNALAWLAGMHSTAPLLYLAAPQVRINRIQQAHTPAPTCSSNDSQCACSSPSTHSRRAFSSRSSGAIWLGWHSASAAAAEADACERSTPVGGRGGSAPAGPAVGAGAVKGRSAAGAALAGREVASRDLRSSISLSRLRACSASSAAAQRASPARLSTTTRGMRSTRCGSDSLHAHSRPSVRPGPRTAAHAQLMCCACASDPATHPSCGAALPAACAGRPPASAAAPCPAAPPSSGAAARGRGPACTRQSRGSSCRSGAAAPPARQNRRN